MATAVAPTKPTLVEPSRRSLLITGAIGLAGAAYVGLLDPTKRALFTPCPLRALTGMWCPGCGLTRGVHAFLNGHVATSFGFNLFAPLLVVAVGYWWLANTSRAFTGWRPPRFIRSSRATTIAVLAAASVFTVARNLPPFRALAP
jgi:Protein of unknown function (DUF2752)